MKLNHLGLKRFHELDNHTVIDVCGVGLKYFPYGRKGMSQQDEFQDLELKDPRRYEYGYNILRGIEVKISRSDFRNGFICSGCNYNYVLAPMRMIAPYEVPKRVGLIEYNKYKFTCELNVEEAEKAGRRAFSFKGLRVVKRPIYRNIPQFQIDNAIARILERRREIELKRFQL